jgi:predicted small integral membrane protein
MRSYLFWEGLPFLIALLTQSTCLAFPLYREAAYSELFADGSWLGYYLVILTSLLLASLVLYGGRYYWPADNVPARDFRIAFFAVPAVLLVLFSSALVVACPIMQAMERDGEAQEALSKSPP